MQTPRTWPTKIPTQKNSEIEKSAYATAVAMLIRQGFRRSKDILSAQIFGLYREGLNPKFYQRVEEILTAMEYEFRVEINGRDEPTRLPHETSWLEVSKAGDAISDASEDSWAGDARKSTAQKICRSARALTGHRCACGRNQLNL